MGLYEYRPINAGSFMRRLIAEADEIITCNDHAIGMHNGLTLAQGMLLNEPTVDAVEVVHGRWKYYHKQNMAVCTNCSFERDLDANFGKAVSCPNCGARMDGERRCDHD